MISVCIRFLLQRGANVSRSRPSDFSGLRAIQIGMCRFVRGLRVPFEINIEETYPGMK